ncbi:MAG TPA: hypothetical protein PKW95_18395 [bacterium]|nr:hypothetical protein [bacterium]
MLKRLTIYILCLLALACAKNEPAPSSIATPLPPSSPPDDAGRITGLVADKGMLYAGGRHMGVYYTRNGRAWYPSLKGEIDVLSLAVQGCRAFAGTFTGEIHAGRDTRWEQAYVFPGGQKDMVRALTLDGPYLYIGAGASLYRRQRGEPERWWSGANVTALALTSFGDRPLFFGTEGRGVGRCSRAGRCELIDFPGAKLIAALAFSREENALYVAVENEGVYRTADGQSFSKVPLPRPRVFARAVLPGEPLLVAADGVGVLQRLGGRSPAWLTIPFPAGVTAFARFKGRTYFAADGFGVLQLDGATYRPANKGLLNFPEKIIAENLDQ